MSFFETVAVFRGRALFLNEHAGRLRRAVATCGAELPEQDLVEAARALASSQPDGLLRFYATAGPGGPTDPFRADLWILAEPMKVGIQPPARVTSVAAPYVPRPGGWKTGNYWQNVDALAAARRAGCDEALLFNPAGELVSAAMANVFLRIDGTWRTPHLASGARDGVVRAWVTERLAVDERPVDPSEIERCEACFLTNSRVGIRAVSELDGRPIPPDQALITTYCEEVLGS